MLIQHAILGLLNNRPLTGYDMKKIMQDTPFLHWSGNNNQIYKALTQLKEDGCVQSETVHKEDSPTKKLYSITTEGQSLLREFSLQAPEAPEIKKCFLVQLAFCGGLSKLELQALFERYEQEVRGALLICQNKKSAFFSGSASPLENKLWELIAENVLDGYERELKWLRRAKESLLPLADRANETEKEDMNYQILEKNGQKYIRMIAGSIRAEADALTLLQFCAEADTQKLMLPSAALSEEFMDLSTRIAGLVLQKLTNYGVRTAITVNPSQVKGKFKDFKAEINQGQSFRIFEDEKEAEQWLIGG